jgi:glycosyltransferase involved in cell wall biosynthesis
MLSIMQTLPVSAIVPTLNRTRVLRDTLDSLEKQKILPAELIIVDASDDATTRDMVKNFAIRVDGACSVRWIPAHTKGAAVQRNQGVAAATQPVLWFFDDDIVFESECVIRLWRALKSDSRLGGVNAMIMNQRYKPPGKISRLLFTLMHGRCEESFAGRVIGPAVNLLPEDRDDLPEIVRVDWLNTTCTLYRRDVLPSPPFDSVFTGYSLMEDVALSLKVGRAWKLANARTARIYHDSKAASYKADTTEIARMQLVNRHYVMTEILHRCRIADYLRLFVWELFQLSVCAARSQTRNQFTATCRGKLQGLAQIRQRSSKRPTRLQDSIELPAVTTDKANLQ